MPIGREVAGPTGSQVALCDHWSGSYQNGGPLDRKTLTFTYCTVLAEKRTPFCKNMNFSWWPNFVSSGDEVKPYTSNQWEGPKSNPIAKKYFIPTGDEFNSFTSTEWERAFVKAMDKNILKKLFCDTVDRRWVKEKGSPLGNLFGRG